MLRSPKIKSSFSPRRRTRTSLWFKERLPLLVYTPHTLPRNTLNYERKQCFKSRTRDAFYFPFGERLESGPRRLDIIIYGSFGFSRLNTDSHSAHNLDTVKRSWL